jgi:hypothetical protein
VTLIVKLPLTSVAPLPRKDLAVVEHLDVGVADRLVGVDAREARGSKTAVAVQEAAAHLIVGVRRTGG